LKLVSTAFAQFLLAINHAGKVLAATVVGVSMNIVAAWAMIFGHLGFKPMGVAGSAWGQNVGVLFEMTTLVVFASLPHIRRTFFATDWKLRPRMLLTLLRIGVPSGIQVVTEVLAWSLFAMWVMALFGTRTMAANTFMFRYMAVSFMPAYGVSMAVTALVGRYIGMGREDLAHKRADLGFVVAGAIMLSCGLLFFFGRNVLMGLFTQDPQILRVGAMLLVFAAIYQFFDAMYITYNGALRGAGDTFVPAMVTAGLCWGITVFGGYSVARWRPQWGAAGPWTVATAYGVILGFFMLTRFRRGHWRAIASRNGGIDGNGFSQSIGPSAKVSDSQRPALAPERS
jgi:MATE family multidrug resistance protein